jgi:hypothetical protein
MEAANNPPQARRLLEKQVRVVNERPPAWHQRERSAGAIHQQVPDGFPGRQDLQGTQPGREGASCEPLVSVMR